MHCQLCTTVHANIFQNNYDFQIYQVKKDTYLGLDFFFFQSVCLVHVLFVLIYGYGFMVCFYFLNVFYSLRDIFL